MKKFVVAIAFVLFSQCVLGQALLGSWPVGGGNISVCPTAGSIQLGGIEFFADPGILTQGASPAPFTHFVPKEAFPGNVTLAALGQLVTIDGTIELDVHVSATATDDDVTATWGGNGALPAPFPVVNSPLCSAPVPEPTSFSLAAFGVIGLLRLRARRSKN